MANYTCLLLDVDNTLLDFNAAERAAVGITLEHYGMPNGPEALETYHQINRQLWDSLAKGELNRSKLFAVRFGRVMQALGTPEAANAREMNDFYENELANHADLMPGALTALEELGEVATLAIVSNGATQVQESRIAASGIGRFMDGVCGKAFAQAAGLCHPGPGVDQPQPCADGGGRPAGRYQGRYQRGDRYLLGQLCQRGK